MYLVTEKSGPVVVGDVIRTPDQPRAVVPVKTSKSSEQVSHRFICQGCYYIYDEAVGVPAAKVMPGTPMASLPTGWRCPDCGTDIGKFKPHAQ